jgi:NPCBM/NEW2 domain
MMLEIVLGLGTALTGYIWYGITRVQDGLGWPPVMISSFYIYPLQASAHIWQDPKRYGRPWGMALFGCFLVVATIGVALLQQVVGGWLHPFPDPAQDQLVSNAGGDNKPPAAPGNAAKPPDPLPQAEKPSKDLVAYLSDLQEFDVKKGPWPFTKNGNRGDGGPIVVNNVRSPKGLGMHPPDAPGCAEVRYRVPKQARVFKAGVAFNDSAAVVFSKAIFEVWGDDKILWQSDPVDVHHPNVPQECTIDVAGVEVLILRVRAEASHLGLHAVWVEPRLLDKAEAPPE